MRAVLILVSLALALALLAPLLRQLTQRSPGGRVHPSDELVKDLVCNTYVEGTRADPDRGGRGPLLLQRRVRPPRRQPLTSAS